MLILRSPAARAVFPTPLWPGRLWARIEAAGDRHGVGGDGAAAAARPNGPRGRAAGARRKGSGRRLGCGLSGAGVVVGDGGTGDLEPAAHHRSVPRVRTEEGVVATGGELRHVDRDGGRFAAADDPGRGDDARVAGRQITILEA